MQEMTSATSLCIFFYLSLFSFASLQLLQAISSNNVVEESIIGPGKSDVAMFVFGDSLYDPGNQNFRNVSYGDKANHPPYGETFFGFPTGRFSDGRLIPDFIAMHLEIPLWKPYISPYKQNYTNGANFAVGGAAVLVSLETNEINLRTQLSYFKVVASSLRQELGDAEADKLISKAVYLSSIGGVDYYWFYANYPNATESAQQDFVQIVVGNLTDVVMEIYEEGGRKFAFQNVGPDGCLPAVRQAYNLSGGDCLDAVSKLARLHNSVLSDVAMDLETRLPGFQYSIFDYYTSLDARIKNPSKYGFKASEEACCGYGIYRGLDCGIGQYELCANPEEYLFFDGGHPTEHAYSQLAELFWEGPLNVTAPLNLKQLHEFEAVNKIFPE